MPRKMNERCAHCQKWLGDGPTVQVAYFERADGGKRLRPSRLVHKACVERIKRKYVVVKE